MGVPMADSCLCMTENHKILLSSYPSVKKKAKLLMNCKQSKVIRA